jgi:hypothetical protein
MPDDASKTGKQDRDGISVKDYELRDWSKSPGLTPDEIKSAVQKVGPMVKDGREHLGK